MPKVQCPNCQEKFDWTEEMGYGRIECPLCNKTLKVSPRSDTSTPEGRMMTTTGWGTDGFRNRSRQARYGEIKKGDVLGNFRIEEMLGAGAMAVVYKATQLSLDRLVALKILPKEFAHRESFVRQFDSETELLASLNHPNIVSIIDRGREDETYYFAMEYIEGTTLGELLATGEVEEEFFLRIMEQCGEALTYAHSKGIIHRDLKPANIMLNDQGMVKIADFGVAGLIAEAGVGTGKKKVMGTRGYMPPEQEQHISKTDERSDIFALGAVMYRALTNTIPDFLPPEPPEKLNPEVDPRLGRTVLKCLKANPDERYQTAEQFLEALQAYHREITRAHEVCPECKEENPPTQKTCLHCGADLSELFDTCPECGEQNRIDVDICMNCGVSLSQRRQQISVKISKIEERARELAARHRYTEAVEELRRVLQVQGKVFERAREKAQRLIDSYAEQRETYYDEQVHQGRKLAEEGKLDEALEVLEAIPDEAAEARSVSAIVLDVKSRMEEAKRELEPVDQLIENRQFDEAEQAIERAAAIWVNCPGLSQAGRHLQGSRETAGMVQYELSEVEQALERGDLKQAREAINFARTAMPDNPRVQELLEKIQHLEHRQMLNSALKGGQKAYSAGNFTGAMRYWKTAYDMLAEGDERRSQLAQKIKEAKSRAVSEQVVALQPAQTVQLYPRGRSPESGFSQQTLIKTLVALAAAILLLGGLVLWLALSTTASDSEAVTEPPAEISSTRTG